MAINITILYGSETGTAQDVAEQIWKTAKRNCLSCNVSAMNDYNIQNLVNEKLIIFVAATTGQGEPPANMKQFWRFLLRKNLPANLLVNTKYSVLGLGDSSYQKFNFAAKKLNKRLAQLGAIQLLPIGLADDQHDLGIDAVVDPWIQELWKTIADSFNLPVANVETDTNEIIQRYEVSLVNTGFTKLVENLNHSEVDIYMLETFMKEDVKIGTIMSNSRTTAKNHFQDVRLMKIQAPGVNYDPGDVLYVRPKNSMSQVKKFFHILNENNVELYPDMIVRVSEKEIKVPHVLKQDLTLAELAEQYWDLSYKPRRSTMQVLSIISENETEKEKLHEFTTSGGQEELYNYVNRPRRNILEVLQDFPHTTSKLNLKLLFEIMSPIKPRAFSIASSVKNSSDEIHLLVAIVKYKTKLIEPRLGLCSNWLTSLGKGDKIVFWIQKGTFKFVHDKPMILIGPGTGVAPFRSLLLEKAALNKSLEECVLFFGCRNKEMDYHCREDFEYLVNKHHLKLFCAFSRDQGHKIYVQHIIREQYKLCWQLLQNGAHIYLAGNSKNMPNCVHDEFVSLVKKSNNFTDEEAENFVKELENKNRYQTETWG